jgi:hypothetical protein
MALYCSWSQFQNSKGDNYSEETIDYPRSNIPFSAPVAIVLHNNSRDLNLIARGVERDAHENATDETSDGDSHDPGEEQETDTLPVDSLEGTVTQADANSRASNAHGGRHWQLVLGEDENGDGGTHLHGGTARRRVVGDLVAHN